MVVLALDVLAPPKHARILGEAGPAKSSTPNGKHQFGLYAYSYVREKSRSACGRRVAEEP